MILTNKKEYSNIKTTVIKKFRDLIQPFHGAKGFHPKAQAKISYSFAPMDAIVKDAQSRIAELDPETQQAEIDAIGNEVHNIDVWEIDVSTEWTIKNNGSQITALREAKLIEAEPQEEVEEEE